MVILNLLHVQNVAITERRIWHLCSGIYFHVVQVADLIASEFFEQGDLEKLQLKIKPMVSCD